jgi:hypothetical protein
MSPVRLLRGVAYPVTQLLAVIESINTYRDPQPEFEALYLLMSTSQNIDRIIKDFSGARQYAAAHLFFIDGMSVRFIMVLFV